MKQWKRDLGIVRELGPDTPAFDEAVARVWTRIEELEAAIRRELGVTHGEETVRRLREALKHDAAARVWDHVEALEEECRRLRTIIEDKRRLALGAALDDTQRELERLRGLPRTATGWQNRAEAAEARLDKALAALREIEQIGCALPERKRPVQHKIARAAIAEIDA